MSGCSGRTVPLALGFAIAAACFKMGCGAASAARDAASPPEPEDTGPAPDLSSPLDMGAGPDARAPEDLGPSPDGAMAVDGGASPDLGGDVRPVDERAFEVLSTRTLQADGFQMGIDTYDLIRNFGGSQPMEVPDRYPENHPGVPHIYEDTDEEIGDHFAFVIHRDEDIDRDRLDLTDRQRNEIKAYGGSESALKGFEGETMIYRWLFRINSQMEVSRRFTHFFQLKAVGGIDSHPILTISGAERSSEDGIEVRHGPLDSSTVIARSPWSSVTGEWLEAYCRATYRDDGELRLIVLRHRDGAVIFDLDLSGLDLWRGEASDHFVRPKWGIYRSIAETENLRSDEETVRFARFSVEKVRLR